MIDKIKNKLKSPDNKSLVENFLSLSAIQVFGMILPLITLPYVLRVLGVFNYGWIVLANSLIAYFISVTDYSFRITATRDVAVFRNSPEKLNLIYSVVMVIKSLLLLFSVLIIISIVFLYKPFYDQKIIFFFTLPMLFGYAIFPEWFFQGIEKMKYITLLNLSVKIFFTICIFLFIKDKDDYWIYPMLHSLGFISSGIVAQIILFRKYKIKLIRIKASTIRRNLIANFPIFINQFLPTLYNNTSTFLLGLLSTAAFVGIYDAIKKIIDLCITFIGIISRVFFPLLNRKSNTFKYYKNLMLLVGSFLTFIPILFSSLIFKYLNIDVVQGFSVLTVLSLGILGITLYDTFGLNYFIVNRQDKIVMKNTILASVIGAILAYPLIQYLGIIGAAINLSCARVIMGVGLYYKYLTRKN